MLSRGNPAHRASDQARPKSLMAGIEQERSNWLEQSLAVVVLASSEHVSRAQLYPFAALCTFLNRLISSKSSGVNGLTIFKVSR